MEPVTGSPDFQVAPQGHTIWELELSRAPQGPTILVLGGLGVGWCIRAEVSWLEIGSPFCGCLCSKSPTISGRRWGPGFLETPVSELSEKGPSAH